MDKTDKTIWMNKLWDPLEKMDGSPLHNQKNNIRVAAYCRVSSENLKVSRSLESQVSYYTHMINDKKNWTLVGIYFDNKITGRKASLRQGFTRMIRHCEEGKIDLILVKNVSRFSRNTKELIEVVERLKEINVTVYFETENIESTRSDTTYLLKTYASIAQGEIEATSKAVEWGHEKRILNGKAMIGIMFGYDRVKTEKGTEIRINEPQAKIVREIYEMYLQGMTYNGIAVELTKRNIRTLKGKELWGGQTIHSILTNLSYTGNVLARKTTRDLMTNKIRSSEGIRDQYLVADHHPAIISQELFDRVQERIPKNKGTNITKPQKANPLIKRVKCGNCDQSLRGNPTKTRVYYKCVSAITNKDLCVTPTIREDIMIQMMLQALTERFDVNGPKAIKALQRILIKLNQNDHFEFHRLRALTQIQLAKGLRGVQYTDDDIIKLEKDYLEFENHLEKIENDRQFRLEAIDWLEKVKTFDEFKNQATIRYLRAWVFEMVIYSKEDYKVTWIDGAETEIGRCIPTKPKREAPLRETTVKGSVVVEPEPDTEKDTFVEIISEEGGDDSNDEKEDSRMLAKANIEPTLMVKNIQKQLSSSVVMQTSVPVAKREKMRVAAYVRVSTEFEHQMISLKTQYSYYIYLILKDPRYTLVDIYMDDGKSGRSADGRPEFKRLMEDCQAGKVDLIITKSLSRFARNTVDTLTYLNMLKSLDPPTDVWFERENLRALDEKSSVLINLLSALSQEESVNIGEAIAWGKRSLAQRGIARPTRTGYGYYYGENKEWLINKDEAAVVQRIYNLYEDGKKIQEINDILTDEGIPTPGTQKRWCAATINRILTSENYRGNYIYQRYHTGLSLNSVRQVNKGELPMYYIENHHPAIIESEQWERVQQLVAERDKKRTEKIQRYPDDEYKNESFARKLYCGKCGNLVGYVRSIVRNQKDFEIRWWRCYRGLRGYCDVPHMNQKYIEENFSQLLMDIKTNPTFDEYIEALKDSLAIKPEEVQKIERLEQEKEALNQQLYEVVEAELGKQGKDAKRVDQLTEEILKIREKLMAYTDREEQLEAIEVEIKEIRKALEPYEAGQRDDLGYYATELLFLPEIFDSFIEKGTVAEDLHITYQFTSGFEWSTPINYKTYQEKERRRKAAERAQEKITFLDGPEVKDLIKYCKEPRSLTEMREFLPKYQTNVNFKKFIVTPLLGRGILKETLPDKPTSRLQRYYAVKE